MIIQGAGRAEVQERFHEVDRAIDRRFESVHRRLDAEVLPAIQALQHKRAIRDWGVSISLAVTIIYSVVLTVKNLL